MEWPCLKGDDVDSFDSFSIMFKTCPNALSGGSQGAKEIDHSRTMKKMLRRYQCPYKTSGLKRCIYIVYLYTTYVFKKIMLQKVIHVRLVSRIKVQLDMGSFNYTLSMIWARAPTYWILKECVRESNEPLFRIFQESLKQGKVPTMWKKKNIASLYKKGNKQCPLYCRPVSLTSVVNKLIEQMRGKHEMVREFRLKSITSITKLLGYYE